MKYKITVYERTSTSDGAGGRIPGSLSLVTTTWGKVKSLSGFIGMTFQNINGTQGYEVTLRTDFDFPVSREYYLVYEAIHGDIYLLVQSVEVDKNYTKLICKSENKLPVQTT